MGAHSLPRPTRAYSVLLAIATALAAIGVIAIPNMQKSVDSIVNAASTQRSHRALLQAEVVQAVDDLTASLQAFTTVPTVDAVTVVSATASVAAGRIDELSVKTDRVTRIRKAVDRAQKAADRAAVTCDRVEPLRCERVLYEVRARAEQIQTALVRETL